MAAIEIFTDAPTPPAPRPRVLLMGTAIVSSSAFMLVLTLVAVYTRLRAQVLADGKKWLPQGANLQLTPGNVAMATLAMSLVTVAWIVQALRNEDRVHAMLAFAVSMLLGVAYINMVVYGWQQLKLGINDSPQALLIYTITGLHVAMVGVGLAYLLVMGFRALGGQLTGRAAEGMMAALLYWYVTVGAYAVVWYAITITK